MLRPKSTLAFSLLLATSLVSLGIVAQTSDEKSRGLAAAKSQTDSAQTQDPKTDASSTSAATSTATSTASNQTVKKTEKESQDKGFIPSEEISEDFAVSFPVDI